MQGFHILIDPSKKGKDFMKVTTLDNHVKAEAETPNMDNVTFEKINDFHVPVTTAEGNKEKRHIKDAYLIHGFVDYAELIVHRPLGFYSESALLRQLDTTWNLSDKKTGLYILEGGRRRKQDKPKTREDALYILQELMNKKIMTKERYEKAIKTKLEEQ